MAKILDEILKNLPEKAKISDASFEAANIVLYTKNKDFFFDDQGLIREIVNNIKKRIELRPDPSLCMDMEKAKILIEKIVPAESLTSNVIFDPQRSRVIIESEKPGLAIGKQGEILKEIKKQTLWVPTVRRTPAIRSKIIDNIRQVLYEESEYRKKFLNKVGHRIYDGWIREKKHEWVRLGYLGAAREVGRSCLFLQTPESRVLLDCGLNPAANSDDQMYPYLDAPEFKIEDLDAVIVSHSHLDHCGLVPFLFKMGYRGPVYCTAPTRDISALLALDYIEVAFKEAKKSIYTSTDIKEMVKHTICLDYEEVSDITPDIRLTFYNAGHTIGSAMSHLHIGNGLHNWLYTGDLKFGRTQLLESASVDFPRLETVSIESTYGAKEDVMPARHECEAQLIKIIKDTIERKGKVLMPVLGVGRSQEVLLIIENAIRNKLLEKIPVYIHGMVWDITAIHTAYPDFLSKNIRKSIFHKDENPFLSDIFLKVGSRKEQDEIINEKGPCVIMATSGMMSVDANEPILIKNSNKLKVANVGKIIDKTIRTSKKKGKILGKVEGEMAIPDNHLQVPCYDFKTGKLEFKPVSVVIKHKIDQPIYKLRLRSGREVKVTGAHSVMVLKDGFITSKKVEDLTNQDYVVINKSIDANKNEIRELNLFEKLFDNCPKKILNKIYIKNDKSAKYYTSWGKEYNTSSLCNYNKKIKLSKDARIGLRAATDLTIPYKLKITKELARLLGYFVSEGYYYTSKKSRGGDVKLSFGIHEKVLVNDASNCIKKIFGVQPKILKDKKRNTLTIQFGSKLFAYIFKYALECKTRAGNKRIPPIIFNLNNSLQKEFLKGYIFGDGSFYNKNKKISIEFASKSKELMSDISLLLSMINIPVHKIQRILKKKRIINNKFVKKSILYRIQITNPTYINKLNLLEYKVKSRRPFAEINPFSVPVEEIKTIFNNLELNNSLKNLKWSVWSRKRLTYKRLDRLVRKVRRISNNKELLDSLQNISKGYLGFDKIDELKKTKSSNNYVYDFSIEGIENFLAGHGGILLHNTGGPSVEYFKNLAENPKNSLVLTCYQGEGSLGRRIQQGEKTFTFANGEKTEQFKMGMEVHTINGLSGHSSRQELIRFIYSLNPRPKRIIVNHGESSKCLDLASSLHKINKIETSAPRNLEIIRIK